MRWSNLFLPSVESLSGQESRVAGWRYGEIETRRGKLVGVYARWWPRLGSEWDVAVDSYMSRLEPDCCRIYYAFPMRSAGFMTMLYAHSGPKTSYATSYRAIAAIESIARIRNAKAIVCQASNQRLNERMMQRWGYVRHAHSLGDNHYIKRLE